MTIFEAIQKTIDEAKNTGKLMRLYRRQSGYLVSSQYWDDWLFLAYPGGRKILSKEGNNIIQAERY